MHWESKKSCSSAKYQDFYFSYIGSGASWPLTVSVFNLFFKPNYLKHINLLQFETNWPIKPNIPSNFCRCNGFLQWFYQSYFTTNKSGRWYNFIRCPANQKSWNWKRKERTQTIMCHSLFRLLRLDIETPDSGSRKPIMTGTKQFKKLIFILYVISLHAKTANKCLTN